MRISPIWAIAVAAAIAGARAGQAGPNPPTGLTAEYTGSSSVTLDWDDTPGATRYWVFRVDEGSRSYPITRLELDLLPLYYDKYRFSTMGYGYYSKFATWPDKDGVYPNLYRTTWRYLGSTSTSVYSFTPSPFDVYRTFSEYSYQRTIGPNTYVGYASYAAYGAYFVVAVDDALQASLPSPEAIAFPTAETANRLKAPDNVRVTVGGGVITISWDSVSGADLYRVLGKENARTSFAGFDALHGGFRGNVLGSQYWPYAMYSIYTDYARFHHFFGDTSSTSMVLPQWYGAYWGYPLYSAYTPYGVYKVVAIKTGTNVWSPASAESRIVPSGATDIAGVAAVDAAAPATLSVSGVSSDVNGAACTIPAGAVSQNTVLTIAVITSGTPATTALPDGLNKQGAHLDFDIGSATLTGTITVTLPVPSGVTPSSTRVFHWLNGAWTEETTGRVNGTSTVSVTVSSLSPFALGSTAPASGGGGGGAAGGGGGGGGSCFVSSDSPHPAFLFAFAAIGMLLLFAFYLSTRAGKRG